MNNLLPIGAQLKSYNLEALKHDSYAGLMVALLLVPQAIAYAMMAGIPAVYGLYASIFPLFVYSCLGTSPLLSVGPVAAVSIMVFTGLAPVSPPGTGVYVSLVATLTLTVGLMQILFSVLRLGTVFQYIPHSVLKGFMNALALTIILNQLEPLFGVPFQRDLPFILALNDLFNHLGSVKFSVILFSSILFVFYVFLRVKRIPFASLFIIIFSGLVVHFFHIEEFDIQIVGQIKSGFPTWELPSLQVNYLSTILPLAFFIALISFLESFAMGTQLSQNKAKPIDPNQELFALGLANFVGSLTQALPVAGAFSRSAVNKDSKAKSSVSSIFTACFVLLLSSLFTSPLALLPHATLAIIIILAAHKLIDWSSIGRKPIVLTTTITSLIFGLKIGFFIGVGAFLIFWLINNTLSVRK
ncbi:SulP family inorganic anion transporter [Salibacterium aidingense]|uniref:SulP family inorganic anion transporter n=1 Tax=Salibacterium aidingense TaxID=384933 RepID=UPI00042A7825|nr:SulP family inorganic anion transporter [Salibacterium aidingense]